MEWEKKKYWDKYTGFLVNHDKKQAINLREYVEMSKFRAREGNLTMVDLIPALTETGGGVGIILMDGCSAETTEQLAGKWGGDLLQILDEPPSDYEIITCCFAPIWERVYFCYELFGVDKENRVIKNADGDLFEAAPMSLLGKRGGLQNIIVDKDEKKIRFKGTPA